MTKGAWYDEWFVSADYLKKALKSLNEDGIDMKTVIVLPSSINRIGGADYVILWKVVPKEEEEKYMVKMPGTIEGEYSLEEIEGQHINYSDGKSHTICCLVDEIRRLTK